jgi:hypothetical protein
MNISPRSRVAIRAAGAVLIMASVTAVSLAVTERLRKDRTISPHPSITGQQLVDRLGRAAHGARVNGVRQLARHTAGRRWTLGLARNGHLLCFMLGVPGVAMESTCATREEIETRQLLIYAGGEPARKGPRLLGYVLYGVASPSVRSLTVTLSNCHTMTVGLPHRPLYWLFVPGQDLKRGAVPVRFVARVTRGKAAGRIRPLGGAARGSCA